MQPPSYFNNIHTRAAARWDQLERDPELAGPWHQLFRQVQSPRHVVSELLQNADDAGASAASVRIESNTFVFEHNGVDFSREQFASLCRFGFSNKRTLHTIGFRGVGFKSTFSLGGSVEVHTPTLAVAFKKERFTEPLWLSDAEHTSKTQIRVRIQDRSRLLELRKNLSEWAESPTSLFFFNKLNSLTIEGREIKRQLLRKGPTPDSSWMKLVGAEGKEFLLVHDRAEPLPEEAVLEIRSERGALSDELELPPCRVDLMLGNEGAQRLYVVLPTGAELSTPFSCNAPFVQDPARFAIKDPATSPTNRWLLQRIGRLAGRTMLGWLGNQELSMKARAQAYELLQEETDFPAGLNGACSQIITESMLAELSDRKLILTFDGSLANPEGCVSVPRELYSVWEPPQLLGLFAAKGNSLLASEVSESAKSTLAAHAWLQEVSSDEALNRLEKSDDIPRPGSWSQVYALWCFIQGEIRYDWENQQRRRIKIVPVDGSKVLHAADTVIRLPSRRDVLSAADWSFVMNYAPTVDGEWIEWLSRKAPKKGSSASEASDSGYGLLQALALHEASTVDRIAAQASLRVFTGKQPLLKDCVRMAHIMAALSAGVPSGFRFVTRDLHLRDREHGVVVDESGRIEDLAPAAWSQAHILHEDYTRNFVSCKPEAWKRWMGIQGSGLLLAVPIVEQTHVLYNRAHVGRFAKDRGASEPNEFHYARDDFTVADFGFPPELMKHWINLARTDPAVWAGVLEGILTAPAHGWEGKTEADIRHNGNRYYRSLKCGVVVSDWINHFRSVTCLPDVHGKLHAPAELFLRTPDTEPLMGVEPFVRSELDTERIKPLLKLLGVRDTPTGSDKLLGRLNALSAVPQPIQHLDKISRLCEAIDRIAMRCGPAELSPIRDAFSHRAIILAESGEWMTAAEVSIYPDEDGKSPSVHSSLRGLSLWLRVGVSERPAFERTLEWLKSLKTGESLDATAARRVRVAIQRDSVRIWMECGHWLSLDSTWERTDTLKFRVTMQSLVKWGDLFPAIKRATAGLQTLSAELTQRAPFASIPDLSEVVEFRVTRFDQEEDAGDQSRKWLPALAEALSRVRLPNEDETVRIRSIAARLLNTGWFTFTRLDVTPYVEGTPAGGPFNPKVLWQDVYLYVTTGAMVDVFRELADELARPFSHTQISNAVAACIDRTPAFVAGYFASNFELDAPIQVQPVPTVPAPVAATNGASEPEPIVPVAEFDYAPEANGAENVPPAPEEKGVAPDLEASKPSQPANLALIDLYAKQRGFRWVPSKGRFVHPAGFWIEKDHGIFNWVEYRSDGTVSVRIWATDQRLENGVEVAAELWGLSIREPSSTALLIPGIDDTPCFLTGQSLLKLKDEQKIVILPSRFRIKEGGS
jgi:hypothetical protein